MVRLLARTALVLSLVLAGCGDDDDPTGPRQTVVLTSGVPVTNISGGEDSQRHFRIPVPAAATELTITTAGGTGDADLYVRFGTPPTEDSVDDCDSLGFENDELCEIADPAAGDWYIVIFGATSYSGVTLTATITTP